VRRWAGLREPNDDVRGRRGKIARKSAGTLKFETRTTDITLGSGVKDMNESSISRETAAVIRPEGDLVAARLPALRSQLREMVASGIARLTLDLSSAQTVDSAGIGLLISAHNSMKKAGGELTVIHASNDILELFRTMRIHQRISVSGN